MEPFYEVRQFNNLREMIDFSANEHSSRNAFEIKRNGQHYFITYKEYYEKINGMVTALISSGIKRVAICADNCYEYCLTYLAVILSGGVVIPTDKELNEDDIINIFNVSEAEAVVCDEKILSKIDFSPMKDFRIFCVNKTGRCEQESESFDDFVESGIKLNNEGKKLYLDVVQDPEKMCTLLFTSGTTGTSKGVMLCQRNYLFEIRGVLGVLKITPDDCCISILPLHHTFESSITVFFAPFCGAKITFCEGFKYILRNMKEFNPTIFVAVPLLLETVHKRIVKEIEKRKNGKAIFKFGKAACKAGSKVGLDLKKHIFKEVQNVFGGSMRLIICGGAAIDPSILKDFDSFGIQVLLGYGLTECAPVVMVNSDRLVTFDSVGKPIPGSEAKLINKDENGIGEVCTKGGMVMLGYYNNQEATDEVIDKDGWFHTGDLGFIDRKGCYHLTGRCKNVIVTSNGKNIYPEELEYHLGKSRLITSCMVEGIKDKKGEVEVHAQVFPNFEEIKEYLDKDPNESEVHAVIKKVIEDVNDLVPGFKRIKSFRIRDKEFEMTTSSKIKRSVNSDNKPEKKPSKRKKKSK